MKKEKKIIRKSKKVENSSKTTQKKVEDKQSVSIGRVVKYIYPEDCNTSADRKKFRTQTRAQIVSLEKAIANSKSPSMKKKSIVRLNNLKKEVLA